MKKLLFLPLVILCMVFGSCSTDEFDCPVSKAKVANTTVIFNICDAPSSRSASVGTNWPDGIQDQAESVVEKVYTTPKSNGITFFSSNYSVKLVNSTTNGTITEWNGSTDISLTETNNITVDLTPKGTGAFPKFTQATGSIDLSKVNLDTSDPDESTATCTGAIKVVSITTSEDGSVNVTIKVDLEYASYLLVAPSSEWSVLTNVKGFTALSWGGKSGSAFNETTSTDGKKWFYFWGYGDEYVYGKGSFISYGFNLYSTDTTTPIHVDNGKWYALFAAWSSAGESDDNAGSGNTPDADKSHTVGGTNGIEPTANDIVLGGAIR